MDAEEKAIFRKMCHDMRTQLSTISLASQMFEGDGSLAPKQKEMTVRVLRSVERANAILDYVYDGLHKED